MAPAAVFTSPTTVSNRIGSAGLTSTATRVAAGNIFTQEAQPLRRHLSREKIDACCVAAWSGEAGDKTELDRGHRYSQDLRRRVPATIDH
jgi:hypothetical protein